MSAMTRTRGALLYAALLAIFPRAAAAQADWRLSLRGGMTFVEDESLDAVAGGGFTGGGEVGLDARLTRRLWIGAAFAGRGRGGTVFDDVDTKLTGTTLRAHALLRQPLLGWLVGYARAGAGVWWLGVEYDDPGGPRLRATTFVPGAHAGLGVDVMPMSRAVLGDDLGDFALGFSVEATYDRLWPAAFADGRTRLGTLDLSGPGFLAGAMLQF